MVLPVFKTDLKYKNGTGVSLRVSEELLDRIRRVGQEVEPSTPDYRGWSAQLVFTRRREDGRLPLPTSPPPMLLSETMPVISE